MDVLSDAIGAMRTGRPYSALTKAEPSWAMEFPAFQGARFHVVTAGVCHVIRENGPTVTLGPGDAVLFPRGAAHALENAINGDGQLVCGAYQLDQARPHPLIDDLPELVHLPAHAGRYAGLESSIALLRNELTEQEPGKDVLVPALLDVLLVHLIRAWFTERAGQQHTGWCVALGDNLIAPALRAIHDSPDDAWTVQSLGERAGMSRAAFARRFVALVGMPPLTYLTWWRLTSAARLLRTTDAPLGAIARHSGYGSVYAFANAFKREYGIAAGQYRRQRATDHHHISEWTPASADLPPELVQEAQ
ncbi:AraC family transcriptional regulator [Lentzea sp. NBC_00516]|uniref:AraC family transcriptional regulator n=1 Tax=Lentzea sp. NBC_00516 TaxID=2903582 RepID=UPI002E803054|nr:AraC family transcriptional regulator [Lentzea sp. NBC_00516]WUD27360.1 AraC family transcriptional regulator [Lentzea sp. NBC_00516]